MNLDPSPLVKISLYNNSCLPIVMNVNEKKKVKGGPSKFAPRTGRGELEK